MHYLITNDDGLGADGILALEKAMAQLPGATYTVVAPNRERSQCGHQVTTHEPIEVQRIDDQHFACSGSPADCVRIALYGLKLPIDRVVSGINAGGNMGQDLPISGTAAAAREATYHGIPAVAFSHYLIRGRAKQWDRVADWARQLLLNHVSWSDLPRGAFYNINFPHLEQYAEQVPTPHLSVPATAPLPVGYDSTPIEDGIQHFHYTGSYSSRDSEEASDVRTCFGGQISLSQVTVY